MDVRTYDEAGFALTWVTDEKLSRTSHALVDEGRVWLVDPVDAGDALERVAALGTPQGVIQLLDRHNRDCAAIADRLGVPHHLLPDAVEGSPFTLFRALRIPRWRENALWWPARRVLVVAEIVGTNAWYTGGGGDGDVGITLPLRLAPPRSLLGYQPEHLLVGHGPSVHGPAAAEGLAEAYAKARSGLPRVLAALPRLART